MTSPSALGAILVLHLFILSRVDEKADDVGTSWSCLRSRSPIIVRFSLALLKRGQCESFVASVSESAHWTDVEAMVVAWLQKIFGEDLLVSKPAGIASAAAS